MLFLSAPRPPQTQGDYCAAHQGGAGGLWGESSAQEQERGKRLSAQFRGRSVCAHEPLRVVLRCHGCLCHGKSLRAAPPRPWVECFLWTPHSLRCSLFQPQNHVLYLIRSLTASQCLGVAWMTGVLILRALRYRFVVMPRFRLLGGLFHLSPRVDAAQELAAGTGLHPAKCPFPRTSSSGYLLPLL